MLEFRVYLSIGRGFVLPVKFQPMFVIVSGVWDFELDACIKASGDSERENGER